MDAELAKGDLRDCKVKLQSNGNNNERNNGTDRRMPCWVVMFIPTYEYYNHK